MIFIQVKLMNVSEKIKVLDILLNKSVIIHQSLLAMLLEKIGHGLKILESRQNSGERYSFKIFTKGPSINDITHLGGGEICQKVTSLHKNIW